MGPFNVGDTVITAWMIGAGLLAVLTVGLVLAVRRWR